MSGKQRRGKKAPRDSADQSPSEELTALVTNLPEEEQVRLTEALRSTLPVGANDAGNGAQLRAQMIRSEFFSGPFPPPEALAGYEEASPGSIDRIFDWTDREQTHRHARENREIDFAENIERGRGRHAITGLWLGWSLLAGMLGAGIWSMATYGVDWVSGLLVAGPSLAALFGVVQNMVARDPHPRVSRENPPGNNSK